MSYNFVKLMDSKMSYNFVKWLDSRIATNKKNCEQLVRPLNYWNADDVYLETLIIIRSRPIDNHFGDWLEDEAGKAHDSWIENAVCDHQWYADNERFTAFRGALEMWDTLMSICGD